MALTRRYEVWVDATGRTTLTIVNGNAALAGVMSALQGMSNADVLNAVEGPLVVNTTPTPAVATFESVQDKAILLYKCVDLTDVRITLPAPQAGIFLSDDETVNPAALTVLNLNVLGTVVSASGSPAAIFVAGIRTRDNRDTL